MISLNVDFNDSNRLLNSALVTTGFCASETPRRRAKKRVTKMSRKSRQNKDSSSHPTAKLGLFLRQILFGHSSLTASAANDDLQPPNTVALDKSRYEVMVASMSRVAESVRSLVGMGSIPMKARHPDDSFWISRRSSLLIFLFRCKLHGQFRPLTL
jgi:hypothetical protein